MNYSYKMTCHLANLVGLLGSDHFGGMLEIFQRVFFVDHS